MWTMYMEIELTIPPQLEYEYRLSVTQKESKFLLPVRARLELGI